MMNDIKKHTSEWVAAKYIADLINSPVSDAPVRIDFVSDKVLLLSTRGVLSEYIMANADPIRNMEMMFPSLNKYSKKALSRKENTIIIGDKEEA